jgi:ribosomal protein S18 acetylase RimI-like enzyme
VALVRVTGTVKIPTPTDLRKYPSMKREDCAELRFVSIASSDWPRVEVALGKILPADEMSQLREAISPSNSDAPAEIWGAFRGATLVGALRVQVQPGRSAVIAAPRMAPGETPQAALQLLEGVLVALRERGVQVVQALVADAHGSDAQLLMAVGLKHAAELEYLVSLAASFPQSAPAEHLHLHAYSPHQHTRFSRLVERTYVGSLDCGAAEGLRTIDDVLAGYRGTGNFDPTRWVIASEQGSDVGCLIIADDPQHDQSELMYIGVVPEARGRGLGLALVRHAQWMTRGAARGRLVLAVDAANDPAIAIYTAAKFIAWDWQSVFLRAL